MRDKTSHDCGVGKGSVAASSIFFDVELAHKRCFQGSKPTWMPRKWSCCTVGCTSQPFHSNGGASVHGKHAKSNYGHPCRAALVKLLCGILVGYSPNLQLAFLSCAPLPSFTMSGAQTHFDKAIQEIEHRNPANKPDVDFSVQRLDNGAIISTRERIIKDVRRPFPSHSYRSATWCVVH